MLKKLLTLALAAGALAPALAQTNVGVSIGIHQPGVYGRINIGNVPPPALILSQPVMIERPQVTYERAPIYLYVPTTHQQNWRRHCGRYSACNQPVYFVRDEWVRERYQAEHRASDRGRHRGDDRYDDRGHDRRDSRGHDRDDDRGHSSKGRGHDNGKGKGHDKGRH